MADHPFVRGWDAYGRGLALMHNPHLAGTEGARQWAAGWNEHAGPDKRTFTEKRAEFLASEAARPRAWWIE